MGQDVVRGLKAARADVITARDQIRQMLAGDAADLSAAVAMLDRALEAMCPHGSRAWMTAAPPPAPGETWVICSRCKVSWQDHDD